MNDKELKKLKRDDLLQIVYYLKKKNEELLSEIEKLKEKNNASAAELSDETINRIAEAVKDKISQEK